MSVLRYRTVWGVDPGENYQDWDKWFPSLKAQGYTGVEIDITNRTELPLLRSILGKHDLECTVLIHSEWAGYVGVKPAGLKPEHHLKRYREQLQKAKLLKPRKINAQSGDDGWPIETSVEFYKGTLVVDAEEGLQGKVCHETHRNRSLFTHNSTAQILAKVPDLRITADFSHHVVVAERLLDCGPDDEQTVAKIIPHVHHIHARMGTTQASQCPDPTNPVFEAERRYFEKIWKAIITQADKSEPITFVPEYGPTPYHPIGSRLTFSELADQEGSRLQPLFEEWAKSS